MKPPGICFYIWSNREQLISVAGKLKSTSLIAERGFQSQLMAGAISLNLSLYHALIRRQYVLIPYRYSWW